MRLIAGINDGTRTGGGRRYAFPHLVRTLRKQKLGGLIALSGLDHASATNELAGDKKRQKREPQILEHHVAANEIVFMAAEGVASRVHVVFKKVHRTRVARGGEGLLCLLAEPVDNGIARAFIG